MRRSSHDDRYYDASDRLIMLYNGQVVSDTGAQAVGVLGTCTS